MYNDFFYDHTCTIYEITDTIVNGAEKQSKVAIYSDIPCAIRAIKQGNLGDTATSRLSDTATHRVNIDGLYPNITNGMLLAMGTSDYIVVDTVTYKDIDGSIDNSSLYIRKR